MRKEMRQRSQLLRRRLSLCLAVVSAIVAFPPLAVAQEAAGPIDRLMEDLNLKARVAPAPPFVTESRPRTPSDFMPVGTPHPVRKTRVMTPAEVAATEADLDAAREQQQRRAGRKPAVVPLKAPRGAAPAKNTAP